VHAALLSAQRPYLLPLLLLYGAILARHAWGARRFVQQQMAHELERQALAERYREAKEQAENALAEKNWFISAASHDLRQPLHAMGLMLQAAHQRNQDDELAAAAGNAGLHARSGLHVQRPDGSVAT
jgi:K+-sensing histidine kinase KdpD